MSKFNLFIVGPDAVFFDGEVEQLIVRTTEGDKGILAGHESYVAVLQPGQMRIKINDQFRTAQSSEGLIKVGRDKTTIIANSCSWVDELSATPV